jgi:hypothetical protein
MIHRYSIKIKGAIVYDLISERLRGWIYLIIGTLTYLLFLGVYFLRTRPNISISILDNYIIAGFLLLILLSGMYIYKKFTKFFNVEISDVEKYIIKRTVFLPVYLGLTSLIYLILVNVNISWSEGIIEQLLNDLGFLVGLVFILTLFSLVFYVERENNKIIKNLDKKPKIVNKNLFTKDFLILISAMIISIIVLVLSLYVFINWKIAFIFLFLTPVIGYILLYRIYDVKTVIFDE